MSGLEWGWDDDAADEEVRHLRERAYRQRVEGLVLQVSGELSQHPDDLRSTVEAELGLPIWEASTDQLLGCAAALNAVHGILRGPR